MQHLRDRPIRQKITFVIMVISSVVLLLACAALFAFQAYTLRNHSTHELALIDQITAHSSAAAAIFRDEEAAAHKLAGTAHTIADEKDYSVRAEKVYGDEVGGLTDAFNQMLAQIQSQDGALQTAQQELQQQVTALQREISERKRAEAGQARLTAILETTPDIVMSTNPTGTPFYLNRAGREILGVVQGTDIFMMKTLDFYPDWAREIVSKEGLPGAIQHGSWAGETAIRTHEGKEVHVSQVLIAHKNSEGEVQYFSTVMRDMT